LSSIGDIILTTPILKKLKLKYPEIKIDFLVLEKFKDAIEGISYIENVIVFDKQKHDGIRNMKKLAEKLNNNSYDYVFDLHSKIRSIYICKFIKSKILKYKKRVWYKSLLVKMKIMKYNVDASIVKNYFEPFKILGLKYEKEDLDFYFSPSELGKIPENYKNIPIFAPCASKETKEWTIEGFGELARIIGEKKKEKIILIGGKSDYEKCEKINLISGNNCINLAGKLTLKESAALLSCGKYLLSNDSGPFHISRGVKTPTFVIFGPTDSNMFELESRDTLITLKEPCSPCSLHGDKKCPKQHFNCMKKLKAETVFEIIEKKQEE
jgi:ADP-heptose:LPS heptosyltransferase